MVPRSAPKVILGARRFQERLQVEPGTMFWQHFGGTCVIWGAILVPNWAPRETKNQAKMASKMLQNRAWGRLGAQVLKFWEVFGGC